MDCCSFGCDCGKSTAAARTETCLAAADAAAVGAACCALKYQSILSDTVEHINLIKIKVNSKTQFFYFQITKMVEIITLQYNSINPAFNGLERLIFRHRYGK